jgi:hypothetical protein
MTTTRKALLLSAIFLVATAPLALAQGTYTQIDVPGSVATFAQGIDSAGDVSGYYFDADNVYHGFLLSGGTYITLDYPGAAVTAATGISDSGGEVVGYQYSVSGETGFTYDTQTQVFTEISYLAGADIYPFAVNDAGRVVGYISQASGSYGFEMAVSGPVVELTSPGGATPTCTGLPPRARA